MNAITKLPPVSDAPALPESFVLPPLPPPLARLVDEVLHPHPDLPARRTWPGNAVLVAQTALDDLAPLMRPAPPAALAAWLWPVAGAVRNPPSQEDYERRLAALAIGAERVPGCVWTRAALRSGLAAWQFMPAVADIIAAVADDATRLRARERALRTIAESGAEEAPAGSA